MTARSFVDRCVACGLSVWAHRINGRQVSCADLLQRRRELGLAESDQGTRDADLVDQAVEEIRLRIAAALDQSRGHLARASEQAQQAVQPRAPRAAQASGQGIQISALIGTAPVRLPANGR